MRTTVTACSLLLFTCAHSLISPEKPSCPRDGHEQIEANRLPEFRSTLLTSNPFSVNVGAIAVAPAKVLKHRDTRGQERGDALVLLNGRRRSGRSNSPAEIIVKVSVDNVDVMSIICNRDGSGHTDTQAALVREAMKMRAVIQSRLHSCVPAMNLVLRGLRLFQSAQRCLAVNRRHVGPGNPARGTADGFFVLHGISQETPVMRLFAARLFGARGGWFLVARQGIRGEGIAARRTRAPGSPACE